MPCGFKSRTRHQRLEVIGMCEFCDIKYDPSKELGFEREQRFAVVPYCYVQLLRGIDEDGRIFMVASGEDETCYYYPKFCPDCGKKLK